MLGAPASGKTTYARALAARAGGVLLDIDTATEPVVRAALSSQCRDPDDRDSPFFKRHFRGPIYETLFQLARDNLEHASAVIVGPFTSEKRNPRWLDEVAAKLGLSADRVRAHHVFCPPDLRRQRMIERGNPRDDSKLADWDKYLEYYGKEEPPLFPHQFVDTR